MKLCFVGNSHVVAIHKAWDELSRSRKDLKGVFFAASGTRLKAFEVSGRKLICRRPYLAKQLKATSGGTSTIDVDAYDGFVLVGLRLGVASMLMAGANHRPASATGLGKFDHLVSEEAFDLSIRRLFDEAPFARIARMIRSVAPDARIVGVPTPLPCPDMADGSTTYWRDAERLAERISPVWRGALGRFCERYRVAVVEQPRETVERGAFTAARFGAGSVRLHGHDKDGEGRDEDDNRHMNAAFGALMLKRALPHVGVEL